MLRNILIQKGLSKREAEVVEMVTKGLSNKEVANQLFVTEKTIKFHLTNIYKKMNLKSRAQLIVWCMPHQHFLEEEARRTTQQQQVVQGPNEQGLLAHQNPIPRGSSTVTSMNANTPSNYLNHPSQHPVGKPHFWGK